MRTVLTFCMLIFSINVFSMQIGKEDRPWLSATYVMPFKGAVYKKALAQLPEEGKKLFYFIHNNNLEGVNDVISSGSVDELMSENPIFLHRALVKYSSISIIDKNIILSLINNGANPFLRDKFGNPINGNCFLFALDHVEREEIIKALIQSFKKNYPKFLLEELRWRDSYGRNAYETLEATQKNAQMMLSSEKAQNFDKGYLIPLMKLVDPRSHIHSKI